MTWNKNDYFCIGESVPMCNECKWRARWDEVGEFSYSERLTRWPALMRLQSNICQWEGGVLFTAKDGAQ